MRQTAMAVMVVSAGLLMGCGGASSNALCESIGPGANFLVLSGGVENLDAVADGNLGSFATFSAQGAGSYISSKGNRFGGGSVAGAFITPPSGFTAADITVATFVTQEQSTVESATGPTLTITATPSEPATQFVSFVTTLPFDGVRIAINTADNTEMLVYEICGNGAVR